MAERILANLEQTVQQARREGRWADASVELERWIQASRQLASDQMISPASPTPAGIPATTRKISNMFLKPSIGRSKQSAGSAVSIEEGGGSSVTLRERVPRIQKLLDKQSAGERVMYVTFVTKTNKKERAQARLFAISSAAVYNLSVEGTKMKRRIGLDSMGSVTLNEINGQFVLHVPSEYDYLLTATHNGISVDADGKVADYHIQAGSAPPGSMGSFAAHLIDALQASYTTFQRGHQHLPVRTFRGSGIGGELSQVVQRKGHSQESLRAEDDDDDDDDDDDERMR